jgi:hypothetical protein
MPVSQSMSRGTRSGTPEGYPHAPAESECARDRSAAARKGGCLAGGRRATTTHPMRQARAARHPSSSSGRGMGAAQGS